MSAPGEDSPDRPAKSRGHIPALDGVRGLAILLVLLVHFGSLYYESLGSSASVRPVDALIQRVTSVGWCGVDLFFVLSGFLITGILYDAKGTDRFFVNFYGRRAARIFPLYYGVLAAVFVAAPLIGVGTGVSRQMGSDQLWYWLYGVNILAAKKGASFPLVHFWTLAVEEHFYLVWPLAVRAFRREALMAGCVAAALAALGLRTWTLSPSNRVAIYMLTPCRVDTLLAGALLALAVRGPRGYGGVRRPAFLGVLIGGGALLAGRVWAFDQFTPWVQTVGYSLVAVFCCGLVGLVLPGPSRNFLARGFEAGWLRAMGKYSYGIYVYHVFVMGVISEALSPARLTTRLGSSAGGCLVYLSAGVGLSFAVAWVSWWVYERPFLTFKDRFFRYR